MSGYTFTAPQNIKTWTGTTVPLPLLSWYSSRHCGWFSHPVPPQYESNYCISQSVWTVHSVTCGNTTPSPN